MRHDDVEILSTPAQSGTRTYRCRILTHDFDSSSRMAYGDIAVFNADGAPVERDIVLFKFYDFDAMKSVILIRQLINRALVRGPDAPVPDPIPMDDEGGNMLAVFIGVLVI